MLNNCTYNKIKLIHDLSGIAWFIKNHCKGDADVCKQNGCCDLFEKVQKVLDEQIESLKKEIK